MLDLRNLDYDIDLTGFDTQEIVELLLAHSEDPHEDDAPAPPENPASRVGDLWLCGRRRINRPKDSNSNSVSHYHSNSRGHRLELTIDNDAMKAL